MGKILVFDDMNISDVSSWQIMLESCANDPEGLAILNCSALWAHKMEQNDYLDDDIINILYEEAHKETVNLWKEMNIEDPKIDLMTCAIILQKVWLDKSKSLFLFCLNQKTKQPH